MGRSECQSNGSRGVDYVLVPVTFTTHPTYTSRSCSVLSVYVTRAHTRRDSLDPFALTSTTIPATKGQREKWERKGEEHENRIIYE